MLHNSCQLTSLICSPQIPRSLMTAYLASPKTRDCVMNGIYLIATKVKFCFECRPGNSPLRPTTTSDRHAQSIMFKRCVWRERPILRICIVGRRREKLLRPLLALKVVPALFPSPARQAHGHFRDSIDATCVFSVCNFPQTRGRRCV